MTNLARDARHALRSWKRNPVFPAAAVLALAIGIGANTAIFSVADALLLRPLPYAQPEQLVLVSAQSKGSPLSQGPLSWARFEMVRGAGRSFAAVAAFAGETFNLTGRGDPEQLPAARVSANFFQVLGVQPILGRAFLAVEEKPAGEPVVLAAHSFWAKRLAGDPAAVGQHITLDQKDYTVVGVLPPDFSFGFFPPDVEVVVPRLFELNLLTPQQIQAGAGYLNLVARLGEGTTVRHAQAEMDGLSAQYRRDRPAAADADPDLTVRVGNLRDEWVANARAAVLVLSAAVALVLLIACGNVAGLLLARALGRRKEMAVRAALGATRGSLARLVLVESLMLALLGAAAGALASSWATGILTSMAADSLPRAHEVHTGAYVLAFTLAVSVLAGILFGLVPALHVARSDLNAALGAEGRGATSGRRRNRLQSLLAVSQIAFSTVLLIGAGLLVRNLVQMRRAAPGFDPANLLTMNITLPPARYPRGGQMIAFFDRLLQKVRALPLVPAAVAASALPVNPSRFSPALPEGQPPVPLAQRPLFHIQTFTPGMVATLRIPLRRGREFTDRDGERDPLVAMVNEALVARYWHGENPIGKHLWVGRVAQPMEVVGVLGDVRNLNLAADPQPEIYLPYAQRPWASMNLVVRTAGDPRAFVSAIRAAVLATDRDQPVTAVRTMDEVLERAAAQPAFLTALLGLLAAIALLLALVGIYGTVACSVAERKQEMGIRMALGAVRGDILGLVLRQALALAATGIAIGLAVSALLTRWLGSLLYRVSAADPLTFSAAPLLFLAVALAAGYLPARRATLVDPVLTLRG